METQFKLNIRHVHFPLWSEQVAKGGYRAGAGRKKGAATVRTREIANELVREGLTPLEVMIDAMRELCRPRDREAVRFGHIASPLF